jgi:hypothetical protein
VGLLKALAVKVGCRSMAERVTIKTEFCVCDGQTFPWLSFRTFVGSVSMVMKESYFSFHCLPPTDSLLNYLYNFKCKCNDYITHKLQTQIKREHSIRRVLVLQLLGNCLSKHIGKERGYFRSG